MIVFVVVARQLLNIEQIETPHFWFVTRKPEYASLLSNKKINKKKGASAGVLKVFEGVVEGGA